MKFIDEFRRGDVARHLVKQIKDASENTPMTFMEVCGTHTMSAAKFGIRQLIPEHIRLISGPGCPVCVTPNRIVDYAVALSRKSQVIVTTFGDMMKVPGSSSNLDREHARGGDVRVVASTLETLNIAEENPDKTVVFLGVGFETTVPTIAASVMEAKKRGIPNYHVLAANKVMPEAMEALSQGDVKIDGYLCPGHVSAIIGSKPYEFLADRYGLACVISGFEPLDILQSILMLVKQVANHQPRVDIQYSRVVTPDGNPRAREVVYSVFESCDSEWRGIGTIPGSGLKIRSEFSDWDAEVRCSVDVEPTREPKGCLCGQVLQGKVKPSACRHFGKTCTPGNPVGPCMVSSEGTCAAYYKYQLS